MVYWIHIQNCGLSITWKKLFSNLFLTNTGRKRYCINNTLSKVLEQYAHAQTSNMRKYSIRFVYRNIKQMSRSARTKTHSRSSFVHLIQFSQCSLCSSRCLNMYKQREMNDYTTFFIITDASLCLKYSTAGSPHDLRHLRYLRWQHIFILTF